MSAPIGGSAAYTYKLSGSNIFFMKRNITNAQALVLNSSPLTIIPALGSGYALSLVHNSYISKDATAFGTAATLMLEIDTATLPLALMVSSFVTAATARFTMFHPTPTSSAPKLIDNKALVLTASADPGTLGGTMVLYIYYQIILL